jgi:hypothetical protein
MENQLDPAFRNSIKHTKYSKNNDELHHTFRYFIELNGKKVTIKNSLGYEMKINKHAMVNLILTVKITNYK